MSAFKRHFYKRVIDHAHASRADVSMTRYTDRTLQSVNANYCNVQTIARRLYKYRRFLRSLIRARIRAVNLAHSRVISRESACLVKFSRERTSRAGGTRDLENNPGDRWPLLDAPRGAIERKKKLRLHPDNETQISSADSCPLATRGPIQAIQNTLLRSIT